MKSDGRECELSISSCPFHSIQTRFSIAPSCNDCRKAACPPLPPVYPRRMSASRQLPSRAATANAKGTDGTSGADVVHGGSIQASAPAAKAPLTLADRLAQTADARHSAISATRNKHNVRAYNSSSDWLAMSFSMRNRGLFTLRQPMLLVAICACGFTSVAEKYEDVCETPFFLAETYEAFSLMITALAFMLVFRLNRSATRHYGAGELCGGMMIHARDPNPNPNPNPSPSPSPSPNP